jgi:hypothetical protein
MTRLVLPMVINACLYNHTLVCLNGLCVWTCVCAWYEEAFCWADVQIDLRSPEEVVEFGQPNLVDDAIELTYKRVSTGVFTSMVRCPIFVDCASAWARVYSRSIREYSRAKVFAAGGFCRWTYRC